MTAFLKPVRKFYNDLPRALDVRKNVRAWFDRLGMRSEALAKERAPVDTGFLRGTINWTIVGTNLREGGTLIGRLAVGAVYGRRQEWEHATHSFYAYRSIEEVARELESMLEGDAASVWIGAGRGWKGTMSFNPGLSTGGMGARSFEQGVADGGVAASGEV